MKIFIARLMLLVMLITTIVPSLSMTLVYANVTPRNSLVVPGSPLNTQRPLPSAITPDTTSIGITFDGVALADSPGVGLGHSPTEGSAGIPPDGVGLDLGVAGITNTTNVLFYYIVPAAPSGHMQRIEFEVEQGPNQDLHLRGTYRVFNFIEATSTWVPHNIETAQIFAAGSGLISVNAFSNLSEVQRPNHNASVNGHELVLDFSHNEGFSFRVPAGPTGETIVRFIHSPGIIRFETTGIQQDIIYRFHRVIVDRSTGNPLPDEETRYVRAFRGMNQNAFNFLPFSRNRTSALNANRSLNPDLRNENPAINFMDGERPLDGGAGMAIRFLEPQELWLDHSPNRGRDYSVPRLYPVSRMGDYSIPISITMTDNFTVSSEFLNIIAENIADLPYIENLYNGAPPAERSNHLSMVVPVTGESAPIQPNIENSWIGYIDRDDNDRKIIEIRLEELTPGLIFAHGNIAVINEPGRPFIAEGHTIALRGNGGAESAVLPGQIFTFPNYDIVFRDDEFRMEVLTPFRGVPGVYAVLASPIGGGGQPQMILRHVPAIPDSQFCTVCTCEDCVDCCTILIAMPWQMNQPGEFQVVFAPNATIETFNSTLIHTFPYSERSIFLPHPGIMHLGAPRNFEITHYNLRPLEIYNPPEEWGSTGLLSMDIRWIVGNLSNIQNMIRPPGETIDPDAYIEVRYALNRALRPETGLGSTFAYVYMILTVEGTSILADYRVISAVDGSIMDSGSRTLIQEGLFGVMEIELDNIPAHFSEPPAIESVENNEPHFRFPRIYHVNMDTIAELPGQPPRRLPSVFQSMTLDNLLRPELPPVQNLAIIDGSITQSSVSLEMGISSVQVLEFMERSSYSVESLGDQLEFSLNLHISQNEELMRQLAGHHGRQARRELTSTISRDASYFIDDDTGEFDVLLSGDALQALRDGNIAIIENISIEDIIPELYEFILFGMDFPVALNIGGLDENQRYYIYVAFASTFSDEVLGLVDHQESNFSELLGFTSLGEPSIPGDGDMVPTAPVLSIRDVGLDTATVYWPHVELHLPESHITVHYEIVRIRGEQMNPMWVNTPANINEFIDLITENMPDSEIAFLQTPPHEGVRELQIWDGSSFVDVDPMQFEFVFTPIQLELIDNTLASNQIYFYYVRTVRSVNGLHTYSMWVGETVTTSALSAPINLQIYLDSDAEYDSQREFMIRFDAEILNLELLGPEVVFDFSIREEDGEFSEPIRMDSQVLLNNYTESTYPRHTRFSYKISGLTPNTGYTIRVRMLNLRTNDISPWSNTTTTRTDMDQELADEERDLDAWLHYYTQELEELIRLPYWTLQDTNAEFRVVYRPAMFNSIIETASGSQILLAQSARGAHTHIYYIPSCMMQQASQQEIGFTIRVNEVEVIMPANTINADLNDDIRHAISQIDNPNNSAVDYFIRISARAIPHSSNVQNAPPLSPQLQLNFDVVSTDETAEYWDNYILNMHLDEIYHQMNSQAINNWIINSLRSDIPATEIVSYILDLVDRTRNSLITDTDRSLNRVRRFTNIVRQLDGSMIIIFRDTNPAAVINGYRWANGNWQLLERAHFGEFIGIRSNMPGTFIFAGRIVVVDGLDGMANAGITFAIITRHGLQDILGTNHNINLDGAVTRGMFTDSVARIGGSPAGADSLQFLRGRGHFIPSGNQQANITMQEALYLTMVVYEMRTGTRAETIIIRNHGNTANMQGIDPRFLQSIRAAFELGLHPNPSIQANDSVTINEMLQMLTLLDSKVDL